MKKTFLVLLLIGTSILAGWLLGSRQSSPPTNASSARKILYYQSTMHPWVKSDKPGKCTVCGMDLVPIYEGGGADRAAADTRIVMLPEGAPQVAAIQTAIVTRTKLNRTLRFSGTIDDDDSRHRIVSAYTAGRLEKLFVNYEGAEVEAGHPLALFYSPGLLAAAREYTASRKQGNAALIAIGATRLQQMGLTLEQIEQVPNRKDNDLFFEILAPVSGTVVTRAAYEGQYVAEGEKLMEISDFSTMWLQFNAFEQDLPFLRIGQNVNVTTPSLPGQTLAATITFINPNLNPMTRSARVRVNISNPKSADGLHREHELLHKTYAEVQVLADLPDVLAVPRSAVLWPGDQPRVYVEKSSGNYERRIVSLGRPGDEIWEIKDGVAEGERVVVSGNMLIDGQAQINRMADSMQKLEPVQNIPEPITADNSNSELHFLTIVSKMGEALASDQFDQYRAALAELPPAPAGLTVKPPSAGTDLDTARLAFEPFGKAVAIYAQTVRARYPNLKVFTCPMSQQGAEGLANNAQWVQLSANIRNPYFGQEMVDCGTEIPPPKP